MFNNKKKPIITFRCREDVIDAIPHPIPAAKAMPKWFKKLSRDIEGFDSTQTGSAKRCIPILDAVSQGYIIPLWADLHIKISDEDLIDKDTGDVVGKTPFIWCKFPEGFNSGSGEDIGNHSWNQVGELCDLKKYELGTVLLKFSNPWVIETTPGYSVQFKNPSNNWSNDIQILEGVVDTDTYHSQVNFPYVWSGNERGEFVIPKGTPLVHVIPFKRKDFDLKVTTYDNLKMAKVKQKLNSVFTDRYRRFFWHKGEG